MRFNTKPKKTPNTQLQRGAKSNSNPQGTQKNKAKFSITGLHTPERVPDVRTLF